MEITIAVDDPRGDDVRALLRTHLDFSRGSSPPEFSFALDVDQLADPAVTFFTARRDGALVGVAALQRLDQAHAELKSMHTRAEERGRGVGRALVDHLLAHARAQGYRQVSLETGATEEFAAARALYLRAGFVACPPFGRYQASDFNTFMTILL